MDADKFGIVLGLLLIGFVAAAVAAVIAVEHWTTTINFAQSRFR